MDTNANLILTNLDLGQAEFMINQEEIYFFILSPEMKRGKVHLKMGNGIKLELKQ